MKYCVEYVLCSSSSEELKLLCILYFWNYVPLFKQVRLLWPWNEDSVSEDRKKWLRLPGETEAACSFRRRMLSFRMTCFLLFLHPQQWEQCEMPLLSEWRCRMGRCGLLIKSPDCFLLLCAHVSSHSGGSALSFFCFQGCLKGSSVVEISFSRPPKLCIIWNCSIWGESLSALLSSHQETMSRET